MKNYGVPAARILIYGGDLRAMLFGSLREGAVTEGD